MKTALHANMRNQRGAGSNRPIRASRQPSKTPDWGQITETRLHQGRLWGYPCRKIVGKVINLSQSDEVAHARGKPAGRPASRRLRVLAAYQAEIAETGQEPRLSRLARRARVHDFRNVKHALRELQRRGEIT